MRWIPLLALLAAAPRIGMAQVVPLIEPGHRVRVHLPGSPDTDGIVIRVGRDTLVLRPRRGGAPVALVPTRSSELYLHRGRRSLTARGAVIGGLLGVAASGIYGAFAPRACGGGACTESRHLLGARRALGFGAVGVGIGLVAGTIASHDIWVRTWLFPPAEPGTVQLGFSLPW